VEDDDNGLTVEQIRLISLGYSEDDIDSASAENQRLRNEREEKLSDKFRLFFQLASQRYQKKTILQVTRPQPLQTSVVAQEA